jgi:hypothetical protein
MQLESIKKVRERREQIHKRIDRRGKAGGHRPVIKAEKQALNRFYLILWEHPRFRAMHQTRATRNIGFHLPEKRRPRL